uniref:Uncharacterized protein n=1 Tax=Corvus moneduloides TaxID=1196302 RepID=A0A8C3DC55_CORMO
PLPEDGEDGRTLGLVQVSAVHLQTGNLRLGTTYILACIRFKASVFQSCPAVDRNIPAKQGDKYQRGFSELRLNQEDNPFQHYYYPFISEQKGNANMHVLNLLVLSISLFIMSMQIFIPAAVCNLTP